MKTIQQTNQEKELIWGNFHSELRPKLNVNEYKIEKKDLTIRITKIDGDYAMYSGSIKEIIKVIKKYNKLYYIDFTNKAIVIC